MSLAVATHGRGPRLACVHGWGLSGRVWASMAEYLVDRATVQAVDLPGHGDSPAGPAGLDDWTDDVLAAVETPAVVLGWSLGGMIALNAACRRPEAVRGLVLVGTLPCMLRVPGWQWGMKTDAVAETARGLESDFVATLQTFLMQQVLAEPGARHLVRRLQSDLLERPPDPAGLARGLDILHEADFREALGTIACPALVIAGERDRMAHPDAWPGWPGGCRMPKPGACRTLRMRRSCHTSASSPSVSARSFASDAWRVVHASIGTHHAH